MSGRQIAVSTSLGMMNKRGIITTIRISINSYPRKNKCNKNFIGQTKPQSAIRKVFSHNYDTPIPVLE